MTEQNEGVNVIKILPPEPGKAGHHIALTRLEVEESPLRGTDPGVQEVGGVWLTCLILGGSHSEGGGGGGGGGLVVVVLA